MTESVEWERLADHEKGGKANVTPWWELSGMERELAKYEQCEEPGDCDHDHDNAIEYFREQELNGLRAERDAANKRADAAERELAEVREQHQPGPSLHAWRRPDGRDVHGEQDWIRKSVKAHGGAHVTAETCSYVGEWKAADDA